MLKLFIVPFQETKQGQLGQVQMAYKRCEEQLAESQATVFKNATELARLHAAHATKDAEFMCLQVKTSINHQCNQGGKAWPGLVTGESWGSNLYLPARLPPEWCAAACMGIFL